MTKSAHPGLTHISGLIFILILAACSTSPRPAPVLLSPTPSEPVRAISPTSFTEKTEVPVSPALPATVEPPTSTLTDTSEPTKTSSTKQPPENLISTERMLATIKTLSEIRPYAGWRNSATVGETQALDWVQQEIQGLDQFVPDGMEVERQNFHVFLSTETHQAGLTLAIDGKQLNLPVDTIRGNRDSIDLALRFDSDGKLNDSQSDPVTVAGTPLLVATQSELDTAINGSLDGKIVFLDYSLIDPVVSGEQPAGKNYVMLSNRKPAGLILVTHFSNKSRISHGTFAGDGGLISNISTKARFPVLTLRIEDLAVEGLKGWDDLGRASTANVTWDTDVFSPGTSGNLIVRIPGEDSSRAILLGAHIDSANDPGAMDDGSGSAILLELAYVINQASIKPPVDTYLVWFGSEELGLYGSGYFAETHSELLDRAIGMLQIDCLTHPLDGIKTDLELVSWPQSSSSRSSQTSFASLLQHIASQQGVTSKVVEQYGVSSDNDSLTGYNVPNADVIYENESQMAAAGGVWNAGNIHSPYDTIELAQAESTTLQQMAQMALDTVLIVPQQASAPGASAAPARRAVFVASHTEPVHMTPANLTSFGLALSAAGFDVDTVPFGQPVTPQDLQNAALVIVLPSIQFTTAQNNTNSSLSTWSSAEVAALQGYAAQGGFLIITNSAHRLKYTNKTWEINQQATDQNAVSQSFGITFENGTVSGSRAYPTGEGPLTHGVSLLDLAADNSVPFQVQSGQALAQVSGKNVAVLVDVGSSGGKVLVLGDLGILGINNQGPTNHTFWQNIFQNTHS